MFDDEMTEAEMARTSKEYYAVTRQEIHDERMAVAQAYIRALEAQIFSLKYQETVRARADFVRPWR